MTRTRKVRRLALGKHEPEARRIYELARRLVEGEGPTEDLRMPNPQVTIVPHATKSPSKSAWGVGGIGVALEMRRPYPPVEAMVVAGYMLLGVDWPAFYRKIKLPTSLEAAYRALGVHFTQADPPAIATIPKAQLGVATRRKRAHAPLDDRRESRGALPAPERPQLTDRSEK